MPTNSFFDSSQGSIDIDVTGLLIGLALAAVLGIVVAFVYRITHRGHHYERSFLVSLVLMPQIVAVVMMLIRSNLALSLGMVGALSIIRFRTVIKDSRDMVYLFLAIAVGLGCGTYNPAAATVTTFFVGAMMLVLHFFQYASEGHSDYVLVLKGESEQPGDDLHEALRRHTAYAKLRSLDRSGGRWQLVYELRIPKKESISERALIAELEERGDISDISLLAPQLALPV